MTPTLSDVAREAGVSTATVSHVINGTRFVSPETKERVQRAIEQLNYEVNSVARSLSGKQTHSIGLLVADITAPFYTTISRSVEDAASAAGYNTILCNTDEDPDKELRYLRMLRSKRVDGILMAPTGICHAYLDQLVRAAIPVVCYDRGIPGFPCDVVVVDNEEGAYRAVSHLIALGHRRTGVIAGPYSRQTAVSRLEGYRRALREHGIAEDPNLIKEGDFRVGGGFSRTLEFLDMAEPPSAIFPTNQLMVFGALSALHSRGVRVPGDVAIVGFDDLDRMLVPHLSLTAVAQPARDIGRISTEMLIERIEHRVESDPRRVVLPTQLVIRESSGATARPEAALR